jgi:hypothetical protein
MLTYQLQRRTFKCADWTKFQFPGNAKIKFYFEPQEPFGSRHGYSRTALRAVKASVHYNANNGHCSIRSDEPLAPVKASVHYANIKFDFEGNKLYVECHCNTQQELADLIYRVHGLLPPMLSVFLPDAPYVSLISGSVDDVKFSWELTETQFTVLTTTDEKQKKHLIEVVPLPGTAG